MSGDNVQYLTQQGYDELINEKEVLKGEKIPEIANKIDEAKQQGDLSENAEYHQAKEEMAWAQGRLQELNHILENAQNSGEDQIHGKPRGFRIGPQRKAPSRLWVFRYNPTDF